MYKVLPSMRRLAAQILREYGLTAYATVAKAARTNGKNTKVWELLKIALTKGRR